MPSDSRQPLTYRQLRHLRSALCSLPFPASSRLACALPSGPELAALFLALPSSGFTLAPLNPSLQLSELLWELADLPAACLIVPCDADDGEEPTEEVRVARAAAAERGIPCATLIPDGATCGLFRLDMPASNGADPAAAAVEAAAAPVHRSSLGLVMHTSGTTRFPKVVPISHEQLGSGALCVVSTLRLPRDATCLNVRHAHSTPTPLPHTLTALAGNPLSHEIL